MSETLRQVLVLIRTGQVLISAHGYDEMAEDDILAAEAIERVATAVVVEGLPGVRERAMYAGATARQGRASNPCRLGDPARAEDAGRLGHRVSARSRSLDRRLPAEEMMSKRRHTKLVREGAYAAEVEVERIDAEGGWAPYLSAADAGRLDQVREALRRGDVAQATRLGRVFRLTPLSA